MTPGVAAAAAALQPRLVQLRRALHAHPELGRAEFATTRRVVDELRQAGLEPVLLPGGTGAVCDVGPGPARVAVRADLDALPLPDAKDVPYRSTVAGVCHACGHDVHVAVVVGVALVLAGLAESGALPHGVRLLFQPAEEVLPGGALDVLDAGVLDGVERVLAVHCDPSVEVGHVGLRAGAVTSATDRVELRLEGPGGHTARPHRTADLVTALADAVVRVPAVLARRLDPRAGVNLVWGEVHAGSAVNVIPQWGLARGTLRVLDRRAWEVVPPLLADVVQEVVRPYGVTATLAHTRGVPPVVNDESAVDALRRAADVIGPDVACGTEQSLGGEDFGWLLEKAPGALARLGVRPVGAVGQLDLHQPTFDVDEACIEIGVRLLAGAALAPPAG